ncbi:unnamed protein product, partial [marine sediment metagenome]
QVNNLGVGAFKGTVGVDVVSTLDISDTQAQFFLFSATFSSGGFFTKFEQGDVIVKVVGESVDQAFLVQEGGGNEVARFGYDQITQSAIFELSNLVNKYIEFNDNKVNLNVDSFATWAVSEPQLSTANAGFIGQVKTDRVGYFNNLGFAYSGLGGAFEVLVGLGATTLSADRQQTLQDKNGIIALLSDIPAGGNGLYGGSGSTQIGTTTVSMALTDKIVFNKLSGGFTPQTKAIEVIGSTLLPNTTAFLENNGVLGVSNNPVEGLTSLTMNAVSKSIDAIVGSGLFQRKQLLKFNSPVGGVGNFTIELPVDVSGTVALTSDIPQGLAETIAINNTILDSQQIES